MSVKAARPKLKELAFRVYARTIHPELLCIVKRGCVRRSNYTVRAAITTSGHCLSIHTPEEVVTEIACRVHDPLPRKRKLVARRLRGQHQECVNLSSGATYYACYHVEYLEPEVYVRAHEEIYRDGRRHGLFHVFDGNQRLALPPLSLVDLDLRPALISIQSFHTFPDELAVVKVMSMVELTG